MKIAILGARGIPACYSGYDTLVEELSTRLVLKDDLEILVYCRKQYYRKHPEYFKGVRLKYLSAPKLKAVESLYHSFISTLHVLGEKIDLIYFLDPANAPYGLLLRLCGRSVIIHTNGLGWKRDKWGPIAKRYYKFVEWLSANVANALVTDNEEMEKYYVSEYKTKSVYIPYGASNLYGTDDSIYQELNVTPKRYILVVARLEPENNTDFVIEEYVRSSIDMPLIVVGDSPYNSDYFERLNNLSDQRVHLTGRINNQPKLNSLYKGAFLYIHGHGVGGTNPSLLRAMHLGAPPLVLNASFNTSVVDGSGFVFKKIKGSLTKKIEELVPQEDVVQNKGKLAAKRTKNKFTWNSVAKKHKTLFFSFRSNNTV